MAKVMTSDELTSEFKLELENYNQECELNHGSEGTTGAYRHRCRLDLMSYFARNYYDLELSYVRKI